MQQRRKSRVEFLLRLRRQQESLAHHALGRANSEAALARARAEQLMRTLGEYAQAGRAAVAERDNAQLCLYSAQASRLRDAAGVQRQAGQAAQRELKLRRKELLDKIERRKAIEHLHNRIGEQLASRRLRQETRELDEIYTNYQAFNAGATL